jgi:hypothetical protein
MCARRALGLLAVTVAFAAATLAPCPSGRAMRGLATDTAISAPCPCHCGEHAAPSPASQLDPVLRSGTDSSAERARPVPAWAPSLAATSAPRELPDPVPIPL